MIKGLLQQALDEVECYLRYGKMEQPNALADDLRAALAQQDHPTAAMQIAGGAVLLDYRNENEAEAEKRVGALTAARVFIAMQKASGLNIGAIK